MLGQSLWEVSYKVFPGPWAGPESPRFPHQLAVCDQPSVTRGMELKLISSIYCICLSFPLQLKLDAFYLSKFDLVEEKTCSLGSAYWAYCSPKDCVFSANYFKALQLPYRFSGAPPRRQLPSQTLVL